MIFIAVVVCAKFFFSHLDFFLEIGGQKVFAFYFGTLTKFLVWGSLFFCYMEIICSTAYDVEELPEIYMGGIFGFLWTIVKSAYTFLITLLIVELPCIIAIGIFKAASIELRWPLYVLAIFGLFLFPMAALTVSIGRDITMLGRIDQFFKPIIKAFWPYLILVVLLTATCQLQWIALDYGELRGSSEVTVLLHLLANIGIQALAIVTMRAIGIFHRHYKCYLNW